MKSVVNHPPTLLGQCPNFNRIRFLKTSLNLLQFLQDIKTGEDEKLSELKTCPYEDMGGFSLSMCWVFEIVHACCLFYSLHTCSLKHHCLNLKFLKEIKSIKVNASVMVSSFKLMKPNLALKS